MKITKSLKTLLYGLLPIIVIGIYSFLYHVNPFKLFVSDPLLFLAFFVFYVIQNGIDAVRDKLLTGLPYLTVLKARLTGNAYGLILPGWMGQELVRALVYNPKLDNMKKGLGFSIVEGFIDTIAICSLYLVFLPFFFSPVQIFFVFVALGNILGWGAGISFVYYTHDRVGRIENSLINLLRLKSFTEKYREFKSYMRVGIEGKFPLLFGISFLSFWVQGLFFFLITHNLLVSSFLIGIYMVGALIPIPSEAGIGELILSLFLSPQNVVITRMSYLVSNAVGFLLSRDVSFKEVKNGIALVTKEKDGKLLE
ncbi:lysylphosphatidylglycerol synthase domain-containing protein [Sulfuracidifex tepidarius]|uniref:Glycosyltransferase AglD n=1 Tax=Sulfuracidifex tepidarius TaxID=1294262 RepID=A0A510DVI9_9CREN|nr:lysylphosphatidylglycerol synthase domain-containing protein [Sulfuracidifex tepidarius]BBG24243.1 hypothetical protein IC006_1552 [Sulfuracidifex tepidarius]BBG27000.1 hypothetical protein IC007_1529 [Sulfuracidifex tepidarius]